MEGGVQVLIAVNFLMPSIFLNVGLERTVGQGSIEG
jgi:hypothetical protein